MSEGRVGSDTGGTFTDVVFDDGTHRKVPSTPDDPGRALRRALADHWSAAGRGAGAPAFLAHGTTVATNAVLEHRLAPVHLVTNEGFADVIEIARQDRPSLYDLWADRPVPLVPRERRHEVRGRLASDGTELQPIDLATVPALALGAVAAVCLLHSDLEPRHERAVVAALAARGVIAVASHDVAPVWREYERTVTTVIDAGLGPRCQAYLDGLAGVAAHVGVVTSAGGLAALAQARAHPARLLLSGPAAGVRAAAAVAMANGEPDVLTFDMGGTSTDVCLVLGGRPAPSSERTIAGLPVLLPSLDVLTIGAGGGSIARIDAGGALVVGPESAGAVPGPACYGHGGEAPTVTDADLVAGRIPSGAPFPGLGRLDVAAARDALARAGVDAGGVITVVDAAMTRALRAASVERGVDPRHLALVAFGGAGPLHACALADALGMRRVIVPAGAGVLCAAGALAAPLQHDVVRSWVTPARHEGLDAFAAALAREACDAVGVVDGFGAEVTVDVAFDCRYAGQGHELTVPTVASFHAAHERRNGYARPEWPVEVTSVRATAQREPLDWAAALDRSSASRASVRGPAVLAEDDCTVWVPAGWRGRPGAWGALVLERHA